MGKFLQIKEFDTIISDTCTKQVPDNVHKISDSDFTLLKKFIHDFSPNDGDFVITEFVNQSFDVRYGDTIKCKNYVGLIQLKSGFQIEILPKIYKGDNDIVVKNIFIKMLRTLRDFPSKVFSDANLNTSKMHLYEIFINMYIQEVIQLTKIGLKSNYSNIEDNQNFYKGKLLFNEHIIKNLAHKEKFYIVYDEFNLDRPENRIIKSTLLKLKKITLDFNNSSEINRLLMYFENVKESSNYDSDFSKISITRVNKEYENSIIWAKVFLKNKSFTTFSGENSARALLFPMETIFESYIANKLKKAVDSNDWNVAIQAKELYLFDEPRKFRLKPDIVIRSKIDNRCIILDTKWKNLIDNPSKNYGISQSDMYQMYAYSKKYKTAPVIWLIYPLNQAMEKYKDAQLSFVASENDDNVTVRVFFVDLTNIEDSINSLKNNALIK